MPTPTSHPSTWRCYGISTEIQFSVGADQTCGDLHHLPGVAVTRQLYLTAGSVCIISSTSFWWKTHTKYNACFSSPVSLRYGEGLFPKNGVQNPIQTFACLRSSSKLILNMSEFWTQRGLIKHDRISLCFLQRATFSLFPTEEYLQKTTQTQYRLGTKKAYKHKITSPHRDPECY